MPTINPADSPKTFRRAANLLMRDLAARGTSITHHMALEALSHAHGVADWNTMSALLARGGAAARTRPSAKAAPHEPDRRDEFGRRMEAIEETGGVEVFLRRLHETLPRTMDAMVSGRLRLQNGRQPEPGLLDESGSPSAFLRLLHDAMPEGGSVFLHCGGGLVPASGRGAARLPLMAPPTAAVMERFVLATGGSGSAEQARKPGGLARYGYRVEAHPDRAAGSFAIETWIEAGSTESGDPFLVLTTMPGIIPEPSQCGISPEMVDAFSRGGGGIVLVCGRRSAWSGLVASLVRIRCRTGGRSERVVDLDWPFQHDYGGSDMGSSYVLQMQFGTGTQDVEARLQHCGKRKPSIVVAGGLGTPGDVAACVREAGHGTLVVVSMPAASVSAAITAFDSLASRCPGSIGRSATEALRMVVHAPGDGSVDWTLPRPG